MAKIRRILEEVYIGLRNGATTSEIISHYSLSNDDWYRLSNLLYDKFKLEQKSHVEHNPRIQDSSDILGEVNDYLSDHALAFPTLGTVDELQSVHTTIKSSGKNKLNHIVKSFYNIIMRTSIRALSVEAYFSENMINDNTKNIFHEFNYIIDSATISFYRGNLVSSLFTVLPVVEGILLRWQGFPDKVITKPDFNESIKYINGIKQRQPFPSNVLYFDSWQKACVKIIKEHLFKPTKSGSSIDDFNRHLILHLLEDKYFCSPVNVMRCFLLIDLLFELYLAENRVEDFKLNAKHDRITIGKTQTFLAYRDALGQYQGGNTPEYSLFKHEKCEKLL